MYLSLDRGRQCPTVRTMGRLQKGRGGVRRGSEEGLRRLCVSMWVFYTDVYVWVCVSSFDDTRVCGCVMCMSRYVWVWVYECVWLYVRASDCVCSSKRETNGTMKVRRLGNRIEESKTDRSDCRKVSWYMIWVDG